MRLIVFTVAAAALSSAQSVWMSPDSKILFLLFPPLWLLLLMIEAARPRGAALYALTGGLFLEGVSIAPFGVTLGPLLALSVGFVLARRAFIDPGERSVALWMAVIISVFFILRGLLLEWTDPLAGNSSARILAPLIAVNCAGYFLTRLVVTAARRIRRHGHP